MTTLIKALSFISLFVLAFHGRAETVFFDCPCPHNIAHRGASGLFPQSTTVAFDEALVRGADILEMDVHVTADNALVVHHDASTKATAGVDREIADMTLADIKQLDAGYAFTLDKGDSYPWRNTGLQIMTLEEVAQRYPNKRLNIEMKPTTRQVARLLAAEITRLDLQDRVVVASSKKTVMKEFRKLTNGQIPTSAYTGEITRAMFAWFFGAGRTIKPEYRAIQMPMAIASKPFVRFFQDKGVRVHVWTVNKRRDIERMLDMGVDGVMGDYPLLIEQVMIEKGLRGTQ